MKQMPEFYAPNFERELRAFAANAVGPFSYLSGSMRYTYFEQRSVLRGRMIPCVVMAEDYAVEVMEGRA